MASENFKKSFEAAISPKATTKMVSRLLIQQAVHLFASPTKLESKFSKKTGAYGVSHNAPTNL